MAEIHRNLVKFRFGDADENVLELATRKGGVPADGLAVYSDGAAVFVTPVDELAVHIESRSAADIDALTDSHVETDFLGYPLGGEVGFELGEVALIVAGF